MKKIAIIWTIMLILILTALTLFGFHMKKEIINDLMEEALVKQTKNYLKRNKSEYPRLKQSITITSDKLIDEGFDPKLESDCIGYVTVENSEDGFKFAPYLKCPYYITDGYKEIN